MRLIKKYVFDGEEFTTENAVRQAIFKKNRMAFGPAVTSEEWEAVGVTYTEVEEAIPMETLKARKHNDVKRAFLDWRNNSATLVSSMGFLADSNERANTDVSGLLVAYEDKQGELVTFRDANNAFHMLTYSQVKTLQKEIIANGNFAYEQKWQMDSLIDKATSEDELDAIEIAFVGKDFTF